MPEPPNHPLKLPFFLLCAAIGVLVAGIGTGRGAWWLTALGLAAAVAGVALARVVRQGRNPRWMRSPLDTRWPRRPE